MPPGVIADKPHGRMAGDADPVGTGRELQDDRLGALHEAIVDRRDDDGRGGRPRWNRPAARQRHVVLTPNRGAAHCVVHRQRQGRVPVRVRVKRPVVRPASVAMLSIAEMVTRSQPLGRMVPT